MYEKKCADVTLDNDKSGTVAQIRYFYLQIEQSVMRIVLVLYLFYLHYEKGVGTSPTPFIMPRRAIGVDA